MILEEIKNVLEEIKNIIKETSKSVLQTISELCNITFKNLYLQLKFDVGANFCKIRRPTDTVREQFLLSTYCFHAGDDAAANRFLASHRP